MANEFVGSAFYGIWTTATGTTTLNTDYRNFSYTPSISFVDCTAGADTATQRIQSFKDGAVTCDMLMLDNMGTAVPTQLAEGMVGTLIWGESGTAGGKTKVTLPAISQGITRTSPYNDVVTITASWLQNGPRVDGTY
jgi:hypothetical protein